MRETQTPFYTGRDLSQCCVSVWYCTCPGLLSLVGIVTRRCEINIAEDAGFHCKEIVWTLCNFCCFHWCKTWWRFFFFWSKLGLSFTKSLQLGICISDVFVGLDPQVPSMVAIEWGPSLTIQVDWWELRKHYFLWVSGRESCCYTVDIQVRCFLMMLFLCMWSWEH